MASVVGLWLACGGVAGVWWCGWRMVVWLVCGGVDGVIVFVSFYRQLTSLERFAVNYMESQMMPVASDELNKAEVLSVAVCCCPMLFDVFLLFITVYCGWILFLIDFAVFRYFCVCACSLFVYLFSFFIIYN